MADNKFVNKNGQLERKIDLSGQKQFYREGKDIFDATTQRRITLPEWEKNWTGRAQEVGAPIGRTETLLPQSNIAPQVQTAPAPLNQSDNFALILTNILNKAQGATYKDLVLKKRELQREVLNRQMSDIPEPLAGNLSYAEMTGLRSAKAKALSSDIDRNAADIAQYEFIFDKAKSISEEFAKNMKAPDNIVTAYARAIEADPDRLDEIIAAGKVNQKTFDAIMTKIDFSKLQPKEKLPETQVVTAGGRNLLINKQTGETIKDLGGAYKESGTGGGDGGNKITSTELNDEEKQFKKDLRVQIENLAKYGSEYWGVAWDTLRGLYPENKYPEITNKFLDDILNKDKYYPI